MNATGSIRITFIFLLIYFISTTSVYAQEYNFEAGGNNTYTSAQKIPQPQNLQYIYGVITKGDDKTDYYEFELVKSTAAMQISLVVPNKEEYTNFKPTLVFIDPRLEKMQGDVPFGFPTNLGGAAYPWPKGNNKVYTDELLFEDLHQGPYIRKNMPSGRYVIAVFDPMSMGGRYALLIGADKPKETIIGKFAAFWALLRIKLLIY